MTDRMTNAEIEALCEVLEDEAVTAEEHGYYFRASTYVDALTAIRQLQQPWQGIESAPRDGTQIFALYDGKRYIARWGSVWHPDNKMWVVDTPFSDPPTVTPLGPELDTAGNLHMFGKTGPTAWMPLPHAPEPGQ